MKIKKTCKITLARKANQEIQLIIGEESSSCTHEMFIAPVSVGSLEVDLEESVQRPNFLFGAYETASAKRLNMFIYKRLYS